MNRASFGMTDVGRRRDSNEDSFLDADDLGLYAVADGMGGHAAGEVASRLAIETLSRTMRDQNWSGTAPSIDEVGKALRDAIATANRKICESVETRLEWRGMGTTMVAMAAVGSDAVIAYVGDSRAYRLRDGQIERLTSDHSWVNEQVKMGLLTDEDAQHHPMRNIVTRALGNRVDVTVDLVRDAMRSGDVYLLCSDGLNTMLGDTEIQKLLARHAGDPRQACEALVDSANERGGEDNTTVIAVRVTD